MQLRIFGPPGTGKTTRLLNEVDKAMERRIGPDKIGFISFTRQAVNEAVSRAETRFGFTKDELPYFRTIHSLSFRQSGFKTFEVMKPEHYQEIGEILGIEINGRTLSPEGIPLDLVRGDRLLFVENLARMTGRPVADIWEEYDDLEVTLPEVRQFAAVLRQYKTKNGMIDFTDMLSSFLESSICPEFDILFVDEAQDLNPLQWKIVEKLATRSRDLVVAGDDDQAIYRWSGADVSYFLSRKYDKNEVLGQSYRIPRAVHHEAAEIVRGISYRQDKAFSPRPAEGRVDAYQELDDVDLDSGQWLILVRNNYQIRPLVRHLRGAGYFYRTSWEDVSKDEGLQAAYTWEHLRAGRPESPEKVFGMVKYLQAADLSATARRTIEQSTAPLSMADLIALGLQAAPFALWHEVLRIPDEDKEYFIAALRRGEKLSRTPRITVSTIHGAKGSEAENVLLMTDVSARCRRNIEINGDDEARVFYVAVTRAKERLSILLPRTRHFYPYFGV